MLSLLTLNVSNPPPERAKALLEWLWHQPEDVLVLTELGKGPGSGLMAQVCRAAGFSVLLTDRSDLGVMVVGRSVDVRADDGAKPLGQLPGRVNPVVIEGIPQVRLLGVYGAASDPVRYSSQAQRARKREWLSEFDGWLGDWLAADDAPAVVMGDLNLVDPQHDSRLKYVLAEETDFYLDLTRKHSLTDAFRRVTPEGDAISWVDHSGEGCRYDHAFVTPTLAPAVLSCELDHTPRLNNLTDHSALSLSLSIG